MKEQIARLDMQVAFWLILLVGTLACLYSLSFYQNAQRFRWLAAAQKRAEKYEFSLDTLGGFSYARLALASVLGLFMELLMIRWISSEVRIFAYLKNYVLVSCFLGFGLGCYLCRKKINLIALLAPLFSLVFLIKFPWEPLRELISALPSYLGVASEVNFFGIPSVPVSFLSILGLFAAVAITVPLFILNAMAFIPLGQFVGGYLETAPRGIRAYSVNILGSLAGIVLFTVLCCEGTAPSPSSTRSPRPGPKNAFRDSNWFPSLTCRACQPLDARESSADSSRQLPCFTEDASFAGRRFPCRFIFTKSATRRRP